MNLTCQTCQKTYTCTNCSSPIKPTISPNSNNNKKFELAELTGTLQRNLGSKHDRNGKEFYFGVLNLDDGKEQVIFFFEPEYELQTRLSELSKGDRIKALGSFSPTGSFKVKELVDGGSEVF